MRVFCSGIALDGNAYWSLTNGRVVRVTPSPVFQGEFYTQAQCSARDTWNLSVVSGCRHLNTFLSQRIIRSGCNETPHQLHLILVFKPDTIVKELSVQKLYRPGKDAEHPTGESREKCGNNYVAEFPSPLFVALMVVDKKSGTEDSGYAEVI